MEGICDLAAKGYPIIGVVGDGIRGVPNAINYPYQFCQSLATQNRMVLSTLSEAVFLLPCITAASCVKIDTWGGVKTLQFVNFCT